MDQRILDYLHATKDRSVADLQTLVRMPAVAAQDRGVRECAAWLIEFMQEIGITPQVVEEANYPVILAEVPGESSKSLLVYLHYDVQPADEPEWRHDPFGAEIVDGKMYGRGTVDDKGPVMAVLEAVRAYLECGLKPPVTVKFLIEGEEEVGSPSLKPVLNDYQDFLRSDGLVNYDDNVWFDGRPRVVCGIKGTAKFRLEVKTKREFHAMMSPLVINAAWCLIYALNSLVAPDGHILIPDFYDDVVPPQAKDIEVLKGLNWDGKETLEASGQTEFVGGRTGLDAASALILEPTCNLLGITGGYVAPNTKGVVPNFAAAELRFGTVPNQNPATIAEKVRRHLDAQGFEDVDVTLMGGNPWARTPVDSPLALALAKSLDIAFGRGVAIQPSFPGSGPEGIFQELFPDMQQAYSGFGPTEDNLHAPNEYIVVDDYLRGIEATARLFAEFAK